MKVFLLFAGCIVLIAHTVQATPILLLSAHDTVTINTFAYTDYLLDNSAMLTLDDVMRSEFSPLEDFNLGYLLTPVWIRVVIQNEGQDQQTRIVYNLRVNLNYADVYLVTEDKNLLEHYQIGFWQASDNKPLQVRYPAFPLTLQPNERVIMYMRLQNIGTLDPVFVLQTPADFSAKVERDILLWGLMGGAMLGLLIYNIVIFFQLREWQFLLYVVHVSSYLLLHYTINGILSILLPWFAPVTIVYSTWFTPFIVIAGAAVFTMVFFNTRTHFKRVNTFLWGVLAFSILGLFYGLTVVMQPELRVFSIYILIPLAFIPMAMVGIGMLGIARGLHGSIYYTLGSAALSIAVFMGIFMHLGYIPMREESLSIIPLAWFCNAIFLALALSSRVQLIKEALEKDRQLLLLQSRFASMGHMMSNITHQWKVPLVRLGMQMTQVEASLNFEAPKKALATVDALLPKMRTNLDFIQQTADDFQHFLQRDHSKKCFMVKKQISEVIDLLSGKIALVMASVEVFDHTNGAKITNHAHAFGHVIMILIDNALDMLNDRHIKDARIVIHIHQHQEHIVVCVEDNAKGITLKPIETIFSPFVSHKNSDGTGMGLAIAQLLVTERLRGQLSVINTTSGAKFTLRIPTLVETTSATVVFPSS